MAVSTTKVVVISIFLILGMVLAGVLMQPEASLASLEYQRERLSQQFQRRGEAYLPAQLCHPRALQPQQPALEV